MHSKLLNEESGRRVFALVMETGDEVISSVRDFAEEQKLTAAQLSAIGALSEAVLGYYDWDNKQFSKNPIHEQVEVASLLGDIALSPDGSPSVHLHAVVGDKNSRAYAGHLVEGRVRPTLEVIITEAPGYLRKRRDPVTGLALIDLDL